MAKNKQFFGDYPPFLLLEGIYGSIDKKERRPVSVWATKREGFSWVDRMEQNVSHPCAWYSSRHSPGS